MSTVRVVQGKNHPIKVVPTNSQTTVLSERDMEMDARAQKAVKVAVEKAVFCKKPVAKYDTVSKKAYVEYANGARKYVE